MGSTKEQRVSSPLTSELAVDERERRLQRRRERERARRDSEAAEQREEWLRKRQIDRARRAAQKLQDTYSINNRNFNVIILLRNLNFCSYTVTSTS